MNTVTYKGYQASVQFDDGALFVKVLHIDDLLIAEVDAASKAQKALEDMIEGYLADCVEEGREPTKPFKGSFNVRVTPELHKRVTMRAADEGCSLNSWVNIAIEEKLECGRLSERIDGVISKSRVVFDRETLVQWFQRYRNVESSFHHRRLQEVQMNYSLWNEPDPHQVTPAIVGRAFAPREKLHG